MQSAGGASRRIPAWFETAACVVCVHHVEQFTLQVWCWVSSSWEEALLQRNSLHRDFTGT